MHTYIHTYIYMYMWAHITCDCRIISILQQQVFHGGIYYGTQANRETTHLCYVVVQKCAELCLNTLQHSSPSRVTPRLSGICAMGPLLTATGS